MSCFFGHKWGKYEPVKVAAMINKRYLYENGPEVGSYTFDRYTQTKVCTKCGISRTVHLQDVRTEK